MKYLLYLLFFLLNSCNPVSSTDQGFVESGFLSSVENTKPTLSDLSSQTVTPNTTSSAISFTVDEGSSSEEDYQTLSISAESSNTTLLSNTGISISYSDNGGASADLLSPSLTITPNTDQSGTATVTLTVTDSEGLQTQKSFTVTVTFDTDAESYFTAIATAGGTISNYTHRGYVHDFVTTLKSAGIWTALIDIGLFLGDDLTSALVKLKSPSGVSSTLTNVNFVAGDYSAATGLTGDGTKYLVTNVIPSTHLSFTSHHLSALCRTAFVAGINQFLIGIGSFGTDRLFIRKAADNNNYGHSFNSSNPAVNSTSPLSAGNYVVSRINSADLRLYRDGAQIGSTVSSAQSGTAPTSAIRIFDGIPGVGLYTGTVVFYSIGDGLTSAEVSSLNTAVQTLQTSLGR